MTVTETAPVPVNADNEQAQKRATDNTTKGGIDESAT
jgi:hypothetical protein